MFRGEWMGWDGSSGTWMIFGDVNGTCSPRIHHHWGIYREYEANPRYYSIGSQVSRFLCQSGAIFSNLHSIPWPICNFSKHSSRKNREHIYKILQDISIRGYLKRFEKDEPWIVWFRPFPAGVWWFCRAVSPFFCFAGPWNCCGKVVTTGGEGNSEASEQDVPGRARVTGPQRCQSGERDFSTEWLGMLEDFSRSTFVTYQNFGWYELIPMSLASFVGKHHIAVYYLNVYWVYCRFFGSEKLGWHHHDQQTLSRGNDDQRNCWIGRTAAVQRSSKIIAGHREWCSDCITMGLASNNMYPLII